jgi:hypothetical protein
LVALSGGRWLAENERERGQVMKTREQIELEIEKVLAEMQEIGEEGEERDVRSGWVIALRWTLKEGEDK